MAIFGTVSVSGQSMAPTYNDGDWLLVRYVKGKNGKGKSPYKPGDVVVVYRKINESAAAPSYLVKRIKEISPDGIFLLGDNQAASTDSRLWGAVAHQEVIGKVLLRYHKGKTLKKL
jgi:nickel-type superoxide dismutase maturation protease